MSRETKGGRCRHLAHGDAALHRHKRDRRVSNLVRRAVGADAGVGAGCRGSGSQACKEEAKEMNGGLSPVFHIIIIYVDFTRYFRVQTTHLISTHIFRHT